MVYFSNGYLCGDERNGFKIKIADNIFTDYVFWLAAFIYNMLLGVTYSERIKCVLLNDV